MVVWSCVLQVPRPQWAQTSASCVLSPDLPSPRIDHLYLWTMPARCLQRSHGPHGPLLLSRAAQCSLALADKHSCGLLLCVNPDPAGSTPVCGLPTSIVHDFRGGPLRLKTGQLTFLSRKGAPASPLYIPTRASCPHTLAPLTR